jgi:hypothetical protein
MAPIPRNLHDFLVNTLGADYVVQTDDIGNSSQVQIFRASPQSRECGMSNFGSGGIVAKTPRHGRASRTLARESRNLRILAEHFPLPVSCGHRDASDLTPGSSPWSQLVPIPKVIPLTPPPGESPDAGDHTRIPDVYLTELLPGKNVAEIFPTLSSNAKIETIFLLAQVLVSLHSLTPWPRLAQKLYPGAEAPNSPLQTLSRLTSNPCRDWLRFHLDEVIMPRLKISVSSRTSAQLEDTPDRPVDSREISGETQDDLSNAISVIQEYAEKPEHDSYWYSPQHSTLVLLHGDFMLPNILLSETVTAQSGTEPTAERSHPPTEKVFCPSTTPHLHVSGLVDWGDCTLGDRRYDVSACVWSIQLNGRLSGLNASQCQQLVQTFLDGYNQLMREQEGFRSGKKITEEDLRPWRALYELQEYVD